MRIFRGATEVTMLSRVSIMIDRGSAASTQNGGVSTAQKFGHYPSRSEDMRNFAEKSNFVDVAELQQ
jgi:hypothetical protein